MTLQQFRRALADHLDALANDRAELNGASTTQDLGQYRMLAGQVRGLREAALAVLNFMQDEDDERN